MLFLRKQEVLALHVNLIEAFGGIHGLRDEGALEAALTAVENRQYYESVNLSTCAATYAYHLSQAHAFFDGNKRVAAAVAELFLSINNAYLQATNDQIVDLFLGFASGEVTRDNIEQLFDQWVVVEC